MRTVERDIDRILTQLRTAIRRQGFTQLEVQDVLGWGRSYLSQLLTKQKSLRVEQVLLILNVIELEPGEFWREIYPLDKHRPRKARQAAPAPSLTEAMPPPTDLQRIEALYHGLVTVLTRKGLITGEALARAIERAKSGEVQIPGIP